MKAFIRIALPLIASSFLVTVAHAQDGKEISEKRDPVIEKREQDHIKRMEGKAESDGKITKKEMRHIENAQDQASNDIAKKKHNRRKKQ